MSDEKISIRLTDGVDPAISANLKGIAKQAQTAHNAVTKLQTALKGVSSSAGLQKLQTELAKTGLAQQKLATEVNKTNTAYLNSENALNRAIAAEAKAATATTRLTTAQTNSATAAQRLAAAQVQTATATAQARTAAANAATAHIRTATAQTQSQTAAQGLAAATARASTAQTQGKTAAARLAAAQTATSTAASNAAAASDRASLAALRLAQAKAKAAQATQGATNSLWGYVRAGAAVLGAGFGAKAIIDIGDAYTILQNKLQNVTESQSQVNLLTKELFNLANGTRASIGETATAYVRFDRALKILGKSQKESLRLTETVNKALIVSGTAPQEAASALLQLSQGFNAGRLQGDEFRAVSENIPIVLDAVAKALDVPINKVKQMSTEGKITAEVLFNAFKLIEKQVDVTFAKTLPTVGQAMVVAKNKATQFFGELNKSVGFTAALSTGILLLSNHVDILAAGVAVLGTALLVAMGPTILAAISAVGGAIATMTLAIAANPIGLLIVGISTAIALFTIFSDKIKVTSEGFATLQDVGTAVWYYIKDAAAIAIDFISNGWNIAIDFINKKTNGWGEQFRNIGTLIMSLTKKYANFVIASWAFAFKAVSAIWEAGPTGFKKVFSEIGNMAKETFAKDYLGDIGKSVLNRAEEIAAARKLAADAEKNTKLRGSDINQTAGGDGKAELKRAEALEKINLQLDGEISRMFKLQPAREAEAKLDQFLISKKIKLTDEERASIMKKIEAISNASEVQKQFDAIYSQAVGPANAYNATLEAANKLLEQGAITKEQYSRAVLKSSEAYENSLDPLRQYNKDLDDQFRLLQFIGAQKEIEQQIIQVENKLLAEGIDLKTKENGAARQQIANLRERLELLKEQAATESTQNALVEVQVQNPLEKLEIQHQKELSEYEGFKQAQANIDEKYRILKERARAQEHMQTLQGTQQMFGGLAALAEQHAHKNRESRLRWKAMAIVEAGINTARSIMQVVADPTIPTLAKIPQAISIGAFGLAQINEIRRRQFYNGGWTGNMGRDEIAGVVHGQEYVMNAATTSRVGVENLAALQSGAASVQRNSGVSNATNKGGSGSSITHKGDVIIPVNMPAGATRREAREAGAAVADGYMSRMQEWKRLEKDSEFYGVKS